MVNPHKGTAQALKRGVQFKSALADVKNNVSPKPAKWKAPSISLKTQVGVGGLTIKTLMDSENITYEEAVQVYLAYQDSQRSPASSKKSVGTEPEEAALKNQVTPKARPSKAKEATETPPKRGRSSEAKADKSSKWGNTKAEPSADPAKPPKSKRGKTAEAKVAEPSHVTAEPSTKSKRGKTTEAEGAEPSPDRAEPTRKSKRGKTSEAEVAEPSSSSSEVGQAQTSRSMRPKFQPGECSARNHQPRRKCQAQSPHSQVQRIGAGVVTMLILYGMNMICGARDYPSSVR